MMHVYLIEMKLTNDMIKDSNEKSGGSLIPHAIQFDWFIGQVRKYLTPLSLSTKQGAVPHGLSLQQFALKPISRLFRKEFANEIAQVPASRFRDKDMDVICSE